MDNTTLRAIHNLDRRLQRVYRNAAMEAEQKHRAAIERLLRFERELDADMWTNLTPAQIRTAKENYIRRRDIAEGISRNIAQDLARSGETAARMMRNESLNIFDASYRAGVRGITSQLPGSVQMRLQWAMYDRNKLKALLAEGVPGISKSPFTQIAYKNLGNEKAIRRMNQRLQNMFAESIISGDATFRTLTRKIQAVTNFELNRCRTIARTEGARVQNQGRYLAGEQAKSEYGIQTVKVWKHIPVADVPRDNHIALSGTQANEEGFFDVGGHPALYPLDPNLPASESINCHCSFYNRVLRSDGGFNGEPPRTQAVDNLQDVPHNNREQQMTQHKLDISSGRGHNKIMGAQEGEKHYKEYLNLQRQTDTQLGRSIRSYEKNLGEHKDKVLNPTKYSPDWEDLSEVQKQGRLKYWQKELESFDSKLALARAVADERGI